MLAHVRALCYWFGLSLWLHTGAPQRGGVSRWKSRISSPYLGTGHAECVCVCVFVYIHWGVFMYVGLCLFSSMCHCRCACVCLCVCELVCGRISSRVFPGESQPVFLSSQDMSVNPLSITQHYTQNQCVSVCVCVSVCMCVYQRFRG